MSNTAIIGISVGWPSDRLPVGVVHDEDRRAIAGAAATAAEPSIKFRSLEIFFPWSDHNHRERLTQAERQL